MPARLIRMSCGRFLRAMPGRRVSGQAISPMRRGCRQSLISNTELPRHHHRSVLGDHQAQALRAVIDRGSGSPTTRGRAGLLTSITLARPRVVGEPIPVYNGSDSLRLVVNKDRAIMVSGSTVLDIRDCLHPSAWARSTGPTPGCPASPARTCRTISASTMPAPR